MRTLRLTLAGTVALVLLGGLSGAVVAQDTEAPSFDVPHEVTGRIYFPSAKWSYDATWDEERGVEDSKAYVEERIEVDDPRLSGLLVRTWNVDTYGGPRHSGLGEAMAMRGWLTNDGGTWVGTMRGYVAENPRRHFWQFHLTGTGAYEGHSALLSAQGWSGGPKEVKGFVFPGPLPEYPPTITDPVKVVVAPYGAAAGSRPTGALQFVSAGEVGPDVLTEIREVSGRTAAVDIPGGTPITPDLLEPAE